MTTKTGAERDLLRTIAAGTAGVTGRAFFRSLVHHVALALDADVSWAAEMREGGGERARVIASWGRDGIRLPEGHEFDLAETPCEGTVERDVVWIAENVGVAYPNDGFIAEHGLSGYIAVVMRGSAGQRLGYIGVMSRGRLAATEDELAVLSIFASRAAAEVERRRHESVLREREAEVAESRARVVTAADEERRRIGRNLHDGAQQRLVALSHLLTVARKKLDDSPESAAEILEKGREEAKAAFRELQELARGLHPAELSERGLAAALAAVAERSPVPLTISALPDRRLPEVLETTIYYLVSEAITNAVKHAKATKVDLEVTQRERSLVAVVADNGVGGASADGGSGLSGLASRVEALGGTLAVHSPPGEGTRLEVSIPLSPWRDAREPFLEFGHADDGGLGEALIRKIMSGEKTAVVSLAREWDLEGGPPRMGQRLPVMDHTGRRWATIEVVRMAGLLFGEITDAIVAAQSGGTNSLDNWRAAQREYYDGCRDEIAVLLSEPGWRLTEEEPMIIVWFRVAS